MKYIILLLLSFPAFAYMPPPTDADTIIEPDCDTEPEPEQPPKIPSVDIIP